MADSDVRIDSLSIQVESNVKPAADSLKSLALAVKAFNKEVAKGNGFGELVSLANSAKTASENMADAPTKLRNLASALRELSQASKSVKFSKELISSLSDISTAAKGISANVGQRLTSLAQGLTAIRDVGDVRISSTVGSGIAAINEAVAGINVNNMSRIGRFIEELRPLQEIGNLSISGNISREIVNISNAAEVIRDVDFTPIRQLSTALGYLAMVDDVRLPHRLADDIINLGIAAMDVQDVDWSVFERMAAGLRHLEGLGQIRIPRIRPTQQRVEDRQEDVARDPGMVSGGGDVAERVARDVIRLRGTMQSTNDVRAFAQGQRDVDIIAMRLAAARDRLQDLINADGELNLRGIANATEEVKRLERELATAKGTLGGFMKDMGAGFTKGAGISGAVSQLKDIFSSPGSAIGYGLGAALKFAVTQVGNLATAMKNVGVKSFTTAINGLQAALRGVASAASAAGKGLAALGSMGAKALAGFAKMEFKGLMALPKVFTSAFSEKVKSVAKAMSGFTRSIGRVAFYRAIRSVIKEVTKAFSDGIKNLYQWSKALDGSFAKSMDKIATALLYLKNSLGAAVSPILEAISPVLDEVVDKVVEVINRINQLFSALNGKSTYTAAKKISTEWAEAAKEAKKTILGFDEINQLQKDTRKDKQDYGSMFETRNIDNEISSFAKEIRDAFNNGEWAQIGSLVAEKFNGWVDSIDWTGLGTKLGHGINNLVATYNALMDGIDWKNLGKHFGEGIVGILDTVNWDELGRAFSKKINALFGVLLGIFETPDIWTKLGKAFADGMWGFINGIDWVTMGTAIGKGITGLANAVIEFAATFPWESAGLKIAEGANALFDSIDWVAVANSFTLMLDRALASVLTFINNFKWDKHGEALHQGFRKLIAYLPVESIADTLKESVRSILRLALPTLKDTELMETLGNKLARFMNKLFDNKNKFWDTVGETANALIVSVLTIGQSFIDNFDAVQAATSIKKALDKINWDDIANLTWNLIKSALSKTGSFVDALFTKDTNGLRGKKLEEATAYNLKPLGIRMADSVKEVIDDVPWEDIAKTTWQNVKGGFKVAYDFVSAMFGLDESTAADTDKKLKKIGEQIGSELRDIPWATIASDVWSKIKTAFAHAGNFLDALMNEDLSNKWGNELYEAAKFNNMSFGEKLGARISQAIAGIDWKKFGNDLGTGARNLFKTFSDFFNKMREEGELKDAITEFFSGIPSDLVDEAVRAASSFLKLMADAFSDTFFGFVKDNLLGFLTGKNDIFRAGQEDLRSQVKTYDTSNPGGGGYNSTKFGAGRSDLLESAKEFGKNLGNNVVDGTEEAVGPNGNKGGIEGVVSSGLSELWAGHGAKGEGQYSPDFFKSSSSGSGSFAAFFDTTVQKVKEGWENVKTETSTGVGLVVKTATDTMATVNDANTGVPKSLASLKDKNTTTWDDISKKVGDITTNVKTWATDRFDEAKTSVVNAWSAVSTWTSSTWTSVSTAVDNKTKSVKDWASERFEAAKTSVVNAWSAVSTWTSSTWTSVGTAVDSKSQSIKTWVSERFEAAKQSVVNAWSAVSTWTTSTWDSVSTKVSTVWENIKTNATNAFSSVSGDVKNAWDTAQQKLEGFTTWLNNTFTVNWDNAWRGIVNGFSSVFETIKDKVRGPINSVIGMLNGMINGIENAINTVIRGVNSALAIDLTWNMPDWMGGGTYGWSWSPNLREVSWSRIQELAMGGILDGATWLAPNVIAGEAGREAVLPLESHTDWMNDVADRVVARANDNYWNNGVEGDGGNAQYDNSREIELLREQNQLLQRLLEKDTTVEITSSQISRSQVRQNRRAGVTVVPVGT